MERVPQAIRDYLMRDAGGRRHMAFVLLDDGGRVCELGGSLQRFGFDHLQVGDSLAARSELFEGLLPLGADDFLPQLELGAGHYADVHLFRDGERTCVLLLDATETAREQGAFQQRDYELNLLLRSMGFAVLRREGARSFRLISLAPAWFRELCGAGIDAFDPGDVFPFLESFLEEAEELWSRGIGVLRSGLWHEAGERQEWHLEATALGLEGQRAILFIESLEELYRERQGLLQAARNKHLDLELLRKEVDKKEVLLHCIIHDLRGPLSGMVGSMSLLRDRDLASERVRELLELGLEQARYQESMIKSVLDVFSAEVEELETFEAYAAAAPDVLACARLVLERFEPAFQQRGVELRLEPGELEACAVVGHSKRLERVLSNLVENALRHSPKGSRVRLCIECRPEVCLVELSDQGPGVPPDQVDALFDKFHTTGAAAGVAGLGLYFCRRTVELWGGTITYAENPGGGALFRLRLPRAQVQG